MTQYTVDKDGNVKVKSGGGKKPIDRRITQGVIDAFEEFAEGVSDSPFIKPLLKKVKKKNQPMKNLKKKPKVEVMEAAGGGLAEATAKLKAKGMSEGGSVVSMDTSPNSGLITTKGFGAGRKT
jgi:predicted transcriptional regulator